MTRDMGIFLKCHLETLDEVTVLVSSVDITNLLREMVGFDVDRKFPETN